MALSRESDLRIPTAHSLLQGRLALAHEVLDLALSEATTIPAGQCDALREILRRVERLRVYCTAHPVEGEPL
jgi:hypothetical protein